MVFLDFISIIFALGILFSPVWLSLIGSLRDDVLDKWTIDEELERVTKKIGLSSKRINSKKLYRGEIYVNI